MPPLSDTIGSVRTTAEPEPKKTQVQGLVHFEGARYGSSIAGQEQLNQSLLATTQIQARKKGQSLSAFLDFKAEKYLDWGGSLFSVPEIYGNWQWDAGSSEITMGRRKQYWSQADDFWSLGMWQPKNTFDGLRPEAQGLTGLFLNHRQGKFDFLAFASTVYIPSMGPEVKEENGRLLSNTRWYRPPSSTFLLMSKEHQAFYSIEIPEIEEFFRQPSFGTRLCYGCDSEGIFASLNLGYKPMNSLLIKYTRWLYVTEEENQENTGAAPVVPVFGYHSLGGVDFGYRFQGSSISFSYLEDRPETRRVPADDIFIHQKANPMRAYSAEFETLVAGEATRDPLKLSVGYLKIHGGGLSSFDAQGNAHETPFTHRFSFTHAAMIQADFSTILWKRHWSSRIKYMREFDQSGMLANAELSFFPKKSVALNLGADVLGVSDSSENNKDDGFLNSFRANDRIYGGVSYVF